MRSSQKFAISTHKDFPGFDGTGYYKTGIKGLDDPESPLSRFSDLSNAQNQNFLSSVAHKDNNLFASSRASNDQVDSAQ
jgi:hypothetical protein